MNRRGNVEIGIMVLLVCVGSTLWFLLLNFNDMIISYQNEIESLKARAIKYGYARMVEENKKLVFKFNAELECEKK